MENQSNDTQTNVAATDNEDATYELDTTAITKQFATLPEPEIEIASLIAAEPEKTDTESGVTLCEINSVGNPNAITVEEGVAFANPDATAAKPIVTEEQQFVTNTGPKPVPRAIKILALFNKPGAKEVGAKMPLTEA